MNRTVQRGVKTVSRGLSFKAVYEVLQEYTSVTERLPCMHDVVFAMHELVFFSVLRKEP